MGKRKDLSEFDKDQIVMARRLGQSFSKTAALVGCSWSAVVSIYQKWSKEGTVVNWRQGHGQPRLIDARGEQRARSNRRATVAQIAQEVNAGSNRKYPNAHCCLLVRDLVIHVSYAVSSYRRALPSICVGPDECQRRYRAQPNECSLGFSLSPGPSVLGRGWLLTFIGN
ncbi:hypothetical protein DPX16_9106 [Anabarilius grahami]|uniref:Tc3 transposase DNA binding domain-containing protein n=1 Tax=Anabarilius grahami TaxID=495550 RepID=A0A3N0YFM2_ANAGA|nr:hypothetical protein DPX16_9106 [Anabarilius grahami]